MKTGVNPKYTEEHVSALEAQRLAEFIAFGPVVFQVSRLMVKLGVMDALRNHHAGLTVAELVEEVHLSEYAVKVLLEASLTIGTVLCDETMTRYRLSKAGWFFLTDTLTRVNTDFNHDVNYLGLFDLEQALRESRPSGLARFGAWPTIYEGLSELPEQVQKSWFAFDHFYSDCSFSQALDIVFSRPVTHLLDVGGNTGRWALQCVERDPQVEVTVMDLPQQLKQMLAHTARKHGTERIKCCAANLLDSQSAFPVTPAFDVIWMSQFLDCFSMPEITAILRKAAAVMTPETRLCIMETLWDRQKYETAAFCLTQISLYFTAMANGNSKMYTMGEMERCLHEAGLVVENVYDRLGHGHSILECKLRKQ